MPYTLIDSHIDDNSVLHVTMKRTERLNALSLKLIDELTDVFVQAQQQSRRFEIKAFVLSSATEKAFCVGADLTERAQMTEAEVSKTLARLGRMVNTLEQISAPTIAVIDGAAFGGGLELALACDLRIASLSAKMGLTECRLGIIPGAGGCVRLPKIVGVAKAKEMIFLAKQLSAIEALNIGLIHEAAPNAKSCLGEMLKQLCSHGPIALAAAKRAIDGGLEKPSAAEALAWERRCYDSVLHSEDRIEGLSSFLEKRPAIYRAK